jgi:thiol-disulfide isomerase/thioredoxin
MRINWFSLAGKIVIFLFLIVLLPFAVAQDNKSIPVMKFDEFEPMLHHANDTTYIINFWATWCIPCRKELPDFEQVHKNYLDSKVRVILASLDFIDQLEKVTIPFLLKNNITAQVILLNDPNSNAWIDRVDSRWSGSIPATVIYKADKKDFFEQVLDYNTMEKIVNEYRTK